MWGANFCNDSLFACCFTFFIVTREAITQPTPTTTMEPGKTDYFCGVHAHFHIWQIVYAINFIVLSFLLMIPEAATQPPPTTTMEPGKAAGSY